VRLAWIHIPGRFLMILACVPLCRAQPVSSSPASPPKILLLVRQQLKPAKARARERLERATAAAYNRLEVPVSWLELQAFTGPYEALFFDPFDSFEAVEKAGAVLGPLYQAHPELLAFQAGINDALSSERTILAVRRDSPGVDNINLAVARFLRMWVIRTRPGEGPPSAGDLASSVVYQVSSGMPGPAFLIFQAMTEFADIPSVHPTSGTIVEDSVYVIEPRMSHVSRAFAEQDRSFWTKPLGQQ
jgi:hypothetical protein